MVFESELRGVSHGVRCGVAAATIIGGLWATVSHAQTLPNSGSLQRQLRQGLSDLPQQAPPAAPQAGDAAPDGGERVRVDRFVVEGATLLPAAELEASIKDYAGRDLSLRELRTAAQVVADAYRRHGYFARALLPPQDLTDGVARIRVIEGRFGKMLLKPGVTRANSEFVERVVGADLKPGQPYSAAALERGLLLANDLPGVQADGVLKGGSEPGTSDLELKIKDKRLVVANVGGDNAGSRATGVYRGFASIGLNDLTGYGDQAMLQGLYSDGLRYGQLDLSAPLGVNGWRLGLYASVLRYRLGGDFKDLEARGQADTQGAELTYPLVRSAAETVRVRLGYEHGRYHDDMLGVAIHRKAINRGDLSLEGSRSDAIGGGGFTSYRLSLTVGDVDLSRLPIDKALDALGAKTDGDFGKVYAEVTRDQRVGSSYFVRARVAGQWSQNNLDGSEQFALGGPDGVRAYPVNEGLGDGGAVANLELHRILGGTAAGLDLYAFVDAGVIRRHADPWEGWGEPGAGNTYPLFGAGVGANYALTRTASLRLAVAAPIGANEGAADSDRNQDGGKRGARVWFSISKLF